MVLCEGFEGEGSSTTQTSIPATQQKQTARLLLSWYGDRFWYACSGLYFERLVILVAVRNTICDYSGAYIAASAPDDKTTHSDIGILAPVLLQEAAAPKLFVILPGDTPTRTKLTYHEVA